MTVNIQELPRLRDSLSYLYIEKAIVERSQNAIEFIQEEGRIHVPVAALSAILLGPGTSISHAAIKCLAENGCSIVWVGEDAIRCYAQGLGETRKSYHMIRQAELVCDPKKREHVVRNMYQMRFDELLPEGLSLNQIRGMEGVRVRKAYKSASNEFNVPWSGRQYNRFDWDKADIVNRTLSAANALLNGICHAAIVTGGYSPALGFVHTGRMQSFVYDIADLYKTEITIPSTFETVAKGLENTESRVRERCREMFSEKKLLKRILQDVDNLLEIKDDFERSFQLDPPSELWKELFADDRYDT